VYAMAFICLVLGLGIGYLLPGRQTPLSPAQLAASAGAASSTGSATGGGQTLTMAQMKQMADKQAMPLLEKLKSDPNNSAVLMQVGAIYYTTHQFKDASVYYDRAVQVDPKNVAFRIKLATG